MIVAVVGGTGREGLGLALRWAAAGRTVLIGSRESARAVQSAGQVKELVPGADVHGLENIDAATRAEVVVLAIPYGAHPTVLPSLAGAVAGKPVIDTTVALASFRPIRLDVPSSGSAAQQVQRLLGPSARVAAAFQTVSAVKLRDLDRPLEGDVLVCGDDPAAKQVAIGLAENLGMRGLDAGPLEEAGTLERLCALLLRMNMRYNKRDLGIQIVGM